MDMIHGLSDAAFWNAIREGEGCVASRSGAKEKGVMKWGNLKAMST
jgi:hypothetical protein